MGMSQPMSILTSHASIEWFTPAKYVLMVKQVLGSIELDPASSIDANRLIVKADRYYTLYNDEHDLPTLEREWIAKTCFLNPPYGKSNGKSNQDVWSNKLISEFRLGNVKEAILLINSTHGYKWYEDLWTKWPICLARNRIKFLFMEGGKMYESGEAKRGQTFLLLSYETTTLNRFVETFKSIGRVILS